MDRFRNTRQPDWDWWGRLWPTPGATLRELGLQSGETVVEIGSGNGYFALPAARIAHPGTVYAVDLDATLLDELEVLADRNGIDDVAAVRGDARSLADHVPDPADVALLLNAFHGIDDPATVVGAVERTLADGGRFVVVNWRDRPREATPVAGEPRGPPGELRLSPAATRDAVVGAGDLREVREVDLPPHHYALVFEA